MGINYDVSLKVGDQAPDFKLASQDNKKYTLSQFKGKKNVMLVFFPQAFTPICTGQLPTYNDNFERFEELDTQILAVGISSVAVHVAWIKHDMKGELKYPLLSDWPPNGFGKVSEEYDCIIPRIGYGKRAVFIIDKEGIIRHIAIPEELNAPIEGGPLDTKNLFKELEKLQ